MALLNYDFDEAKVLYKQLKPTLNKKAKKRIKFLIKSQKKKFSYLN